MSRLAPSLFIIYMLVYNVSVLCSRMDFGVLTSADRVSKVSWREGDKSEVEQVREVAKARLVLVGRGWFARAKPLSPFLLDAPASNQVAAT